MTIFELREAIESAIPWWGPFVVIAGVIAIQSTMARRKK